MRSNRVPRSRKMWFDTHCHLQDDDYALDRAEVIAHAHAADVTSICLATSNVLDSRVAVGLALKYDLYTTVGIHPHDAKTYDEAAYVDLKQLVIEANQEAVEAGRDPVVVAIGEIGLDYHYDFSPREQQKTAFIAQLRLAHELGLPVAFHLRDAFGDFYEIVTWAKEHGLFLAEDAGVVHCYSGSPEFAMQLEPFNFIFGFDGPVTFKNAKQPLAVVAQLPLERIVLETDAPYLTPTPYRGKRNEPAYIPYIGAKIAEIKAVPVEQVKMVTTANARRLFRLP